MSGKDVFAALKQSILLHFGDTGWGEVGASLAGTFFFNARRHEADAVGIKSSTSHL
jgi:hypothetical protein